MSSPAGGVVTILALSGSQRAHSSNSILLQLAAAVAPSGVQVVIYTGIGDLPHFNPDLDTPARPASVELLRRLIASADGLIISSPEYAHGVPGSLKNALDWLVSGTEFPNIPVALLSASRHSTHARAALTETLRTMSGELCDAASVTVDFAGGFNSLEQGLADSALVTAVEGALRHFAAVALASRLAGRRFVSPPLNHQSG